MDFYLDKYCRVSEQCKNSTAAGTVITIKCIPTTKGGGKIFFLIEFLGEYFSKEQKCSQNYNLQIMFSFGALPRPNTHTSEEGQREWDRLPSHPCLWGCLEFILNSEICQLLVSPWATGSTGVCELLCVKAAGWKYFAWSPYLGVCHIPWTSYNFTHDWRKPVEPHKCKQLHNGCICFNF